MKRIPQEIDSLMWMVAERNDAKAIDDFGARFPEHRSELGKRLAVVRKLKAAKGTVPPTFVAPPFRPVQRLRPSPARIYGGGVVLGLAALGVAAYAYIAKQDAPLVDIAGAPPAHSTAGMNARGMRPQMTKSLCLPPRTATVPEPATVHAPDLDRMPVEIPAATTSEPPASKPTNFSQKNTDLDSVIRNIAILGHLTLTKAPGMPNPTVAVDYQSMTPLDMLKDLGDKYGFIAVDEGSSDVILMPAKKAIKPVPEDSGQPIDNGQKVIHPKTGLPGIVPNKG